MARSPATRTLLLVTALVSMGVLSMAMYTPSLPAIRAEFGVREADVQLTLTLFLVGFSSAQLLFGPVSDRFGRKPVLLGGLALYAVASILCALAAGIFELQAGRLLQGFAACVGPVVGRAVVRDLFDGPEAAKAFSLIGTVLAVVPALAPIIGGIIQTRFGWEAAFWALTIAGVVLLVVTHAALPETIRERNPHALQPVRLLRIYRDLLSNGHFMGHALTTGLIFSGFFAYFTDAPFLFIGELGLSADLFGFLLVFTVIGYAVGNFTAGRMAGRMASRTQILIATGFCVTGAVLLLALSGTLSVPRVIGPMCIYALGFGFCLPACMAEALRPFPRVAGSASAVLGFFQFGCAGLTSALVQPLYDGTAASLGFIVLGASGLALIQYLTLVRRPLAEAET